jgi:hypothetical protein
VRQLLQCSQMLLDLLLLSGCMPVLLLVLLVLLVPQLL